MNLICALRRLACILAGTSAAFAFAAGPAAFAATSPGQARALSWADPPLRPGWNSHPPLPAHVHRLVTGGMPGWQITLLAAATALAAVAVVLARARAVRRRAAASPAGRRALRDTGSADRDGQETLSSQPTAPGQLDSTPCSRRRGTIPVLLVMVVGAVAVGAGGCGSNSRPPQASKPAPVAGGLHFPARLVGFSRNTGPEAEAVIHTITSAGAAERKAIRGVQAAVYGPTGGPAVVVKGGRWSSAAMQAEGSHPVSFDKGYARGFALSSGATDLRSFPAGPLGGALYCGHGRSGEIVCGWTEKVRLGSVEYFYGAATSLSDAASKTNQIRAAIETAPVRRTQNR